MTRENFINYSFEELKVSIANKLSNLENRIVNLKRGEVFCIQGENIEELGLISKGLMKCAKYTIEGDEVNPHYFYQGEVFPEYLLLTGQRKYIYTLVAEQNTELKIYKDDDIKNLLINDCDFAQMILIYMANRGLLAEKWTLCNAYVNARSKIAYMLIEISELEEGVWRQLSDNQRIISTKLHLSRTSYNLELAKLEKEGFIKKDRSKIKILNKEKLMELI